LLFEHGAIVSINDPELVR